MYLHKIEFIIYVNLTKMHKNQAILLKIVDIMSILCDYMESDGASYVP